MSTYPAIQEFRTFTGGLLECDADISLKDRIDMARQAGRNVGALTAKLYEEWEDNNWSELFDSRCVLHLALWYGANGYCDVCSFKANPKVKRKKARSSALALSSDTEAIVVEDDEDDDPVSARDILKDAAHADRGKVSEPKHRAAQQSRSATAQSMGAIGSYLKDKVANDRTVQQEMLEVRKAKLALERRAAERAEKETQMRLAQEEKKTNLALAKEILASETASPELKKGAEAFLLSCFTLPAAS